VSPETLNHLRLFLEFLRETPEGQQSLAAFSAFRKKRA